MKLAHMTWQEVEALDRDLVVVIPTGSLEQHGPHLPLFTDSILATAVSEAVEHSLPVDVLLTPTLWLGASAHHQAFAGTLTNSMGGYIQAVQQVIQSLVAHGFWKFYLINGHGGNTSLNDIALRELKQQNPKLLLGAAGYFVYSSEVAANVMTGPFRTIRHACEAEVSLMLHVRPELVRMDRLVDDGLEVPVPGMVHPFDEVTEQGSLGAATLGTAEKGKAIFDASVEGLVKAIGLLRSGYRLEAQGPNP